MALWRCFYTIFLDFYNSRHWATGAPLDRHQVMFIKQSLALLLWNVAMDSRGLMQLAGLEASDYTFGLVLQDLVFFTDTLKSVFLLTIACIVIIQFLAHNVGEEAIESFVASATAMIP